jgi:hypothetical protein
MTHVQRDTTQTSALSSIHTESFILIGNWLLESQKVRLDDYQSNAEFSLHTHTLPLYLSHVSLYMSHGPLLYALMLTSRLSKSPSWRLSEQRWVFICMYVCMHACMQASKYTQDVLNIMHVYMYVRMYVHLCMYVCIHVCILRTSTWNKVIMRPVNAQYVAMHTGVHIDTTVCVCVCVYTLARLVIACIWICIHTHTQEEQPAPCISRQRYIQTVTHTYIYHLVLDTHTYTTDTHTHNRHTAHT